MAARGGKAEKKKQVSVEWERVTQRVGKLAQAGKGDAGVGGGNEQDGHVNIRIRVSPASRMFQPKNVSTPQQRKIVMQPPIPGGPPARIGRGRIGGRERGKTQLGKKRTWAARKRSIIGKSAR